MKELYILSHLGLGDHILCNAIVRHYAKEYNLVMIPCYLHNYHSVEFMFRDLKNVQPVAVKDDEDAIRLSKDRNSLKLGYYSELEFNSQFFDEEFYRQAKVPFTQRWSGFHVDLIEGKNPKDYNYAFVHDDSSRGFKINKDLINKEIVRPLKSDHIFHNYNLIYHASEIHCINSSFLIFIDSLPEIKGQKLFFHVYPRPTFHPVLKRKWKIL